MWLKLYNLSKVGHYQLHKIVSAEQEYYYWSSNSGFTMGVKTKDDPARIVTMKISALDDEMISRMVGLSGQDTTITEYDLTKLLVNPLGLDKKPGWLGVFPFTIFGRSFITSSLSFRMPTRSTPVDMSISIDGFPKYIIKANNNNIEKFEKNIQRFVECSNYIIENRDHVIAVMDRMCRYPWGWIDNYRIATFLKMFRNFDLAKFDAYKKDKCLEKKFLDELPRNDLWNVAKMPESPFLADPVLGRIELFGEDQINQSALYPWLKMTGKLNIVIAKINRIAMERL